MYTADSLFKATGYNGRSIHGGTGSWPLPLGGQPGLWREVRGKLKPCEYGLHLTPAKYVYRWAGEELWEVEVDPGAQRINHDDKIVVSKARLTRKIEQWNLDGVHKLACALVQATIEREHARFSLLHKHDYLEELHESRRALREQWDTVRQQQRIAAINATLKHESEVACKSLDSLQRQWHKVWLMELSLLLSNLYVPKTEILGCNVYTGTFLMAEAVPQTVLSSEAGTTVRDFVRRSEAETVSCSYMLQFLNGVDVWHDR